MAEPFKCPVCLGRGIVAGGFYESLGETWVSANVSEQCRSCSGVGIIWSKDGASLAEVEKIMKEDGV